MSRQMRQGRLPLGAGDAYKMAARPARLRSASAGAPAETANATVDSAAGQSAPRADEGGRPAARSSAFLDSGLPADAVHLHREIAVWNVPAAAPAVSRWRLAAGAGALLAGLAALAALTLWAGGRL